MKPRDIIQFETSNPNWQPSPRNLKVEQIADQLIHFNQETRNANETIELPKSTASTIQRIYCGLCQSGELKRKKVGKKLEGLGVNVTIPRYSCPVDGSSWVGYKPDIRNETNPSVKAIISEWSIQ